MAKNCRDTNQSSPETISEKIYIHLKDSILQNKIGSRDRIHEQEIADLFEASRTPVREAVMRLLAEGFLESTPYNGIIVKEMSSDRFLEIGEAMLILDKYACREAIENFTEEDIQKLEEMTAEMEKYCSVKTLDKYIEANSNIHCFIWNSLKNKFFSEMIIRSYENMHPSYRRMLSEQFNLNDAMLRKSVRIHQRLLEIFKNKETSKLNPLLNKHWDVATPILSYRKL
ncbi:GntR family transcriptional regulator [Acidobacteriota bacterium]